MYKFKIDLLKKLNDLNERKNISLTLGSLFLVLTISQLAYADIANSTKIKIGSWNTLDFGGKFGGTFKISDDNILTAMTAVIAEYDIVFLQEIAEKAAGWSCPKTNTVTAFDSLCNGMYLGQNGFTCNNIPVISEDNGNCESYGVVYRNGLVKNVLIEYTGEPGVIPYIPQGSHSDRGEMKRPPMKATITLKDGKKLYIYNVHTSPSNGVPNELQNFSDAINLTYTDAYKQNIIALGDFNAGCDYLEGGFNSYNSNICRQNPAGKKMFPVNNSLNFNWKYIINDDLITNFAQVSHCPYDRIMLAQAATEAYTDICNYTNNPPFGGSCSNQFATNTSNCIVDKVPGNPSPGTPFGKKFNEVTVTGSDKKLSDHKLVFSELTYGGISPAEATGNIKGVFKKISETEGESIYVKGNKFLANKTFYAYVVHPLPPNEMRIVLSPLFTPKAVTTDSDGNITVSSETLLANTKDLEVGKYNIVVTNNQNMIFERAIDAYEAFIVSQAPPSRKRKLSTAIGEGIEQPDDTRVWKKLRPENTVIGSNFTPGATANITALDYNNQSLKTDLGAVVVDGEGNFRLINPTSLPQGIYNIFFDAHKDGVFNPSYDTLDYGNKLGDEIGFIVTEDSVGDNNVVTLGDDGKEREVFNVASAKNIYVLSKNLPFSKHVDLYVVSNKLIQDLLPEWDGSWTNPIVTNLDLELVSVPILKDDSQTRRQSVYVPYDGEIFFPIWMNPAEKIGEGSLSKQNEFITKFGSNFNVIIDTDQNGKFTTIDKIDIHQVDKIISWLNTHEVLDDKSGSDAAPAIAQYQELLNGKLNLSTPLAIDGIFNTATQEASLQYICSKFLNNSMISVLKKDAQIGFKVLLENQYVENMQYLSGRYSYAKVNIADSAIDNSGYSCIHGNELDLNNITIINDAVSNINADTSIDVANFESGYQSVTKLNSPNISLKNSMNILSESSISLSDNDNSNNAVCQIMGSWAPFCITSKVAVLIYSGFILSVDHDEL